MNDSYVANIGDYSKLALLRAVASGRRLGVAWYRTPTNDHPTALNRWDYLDRPYQWADLDPHVFAELHRIHASNQPCLTDLERVLDGATFSRRPIPTPALGNRATWFEQTKTDLEGCDFIFFDPDIGLARESIASHHSRADRYALVEEVVAMQEKGRTVIFYHHQPRIETETEYRWLDQTLRDAGVTVDATIRVAAWSPRFYVFVNADEDTLHRARQFTKRWRRTASMTERPFRL